MHPFNLDWRHRKSSAFVLEQNASMPFTRTLDLWGQRVEIYANANLSIYSAQACNARCPFCVEELRPASRGSLLQPKPRSSDARWFDRLVQVLDALTPLDPSVSITGGEPSLDPRLPRLLELLQTRQARKRTLTTNGTGLARGPVGSRPLDWIARTGLEHLNVSIAHPDPARSRALMRLPEALELATLKEIIEVAHRSGVQVRLSCVLLEEGIRSIPDMLHYLTFARTVGADAVIFRQLMTHDPRTVLENEVTRYSDAARVPLEPLLRALDGQADFVPVRQVMGYYYYVEVWEHHLPGATPLRVALEEAALERLEASRARWPWRVHELVYHPRGVLASTWQAWDGVLGPPEDGA